MEQQRGDEEWCVGVIRDVLVVALPDGLADCRIVAEFSSGLLELVDGEGQDGPFDGDSGIRGDEVGVGGVADARMQHGPCDMEDGALDKQMERRLVATVAASAEWRISPLEANVSPAWSVLGGRVKDKNSP